MGVLQPYLTRMYGPAARCKRFRQPGRCGLASMYPASDWSVLRSGPSWISARLRSHWRTGLERANWLTRVRMRRQDRSSISFHPLADLGRKTGTMSLLSPDRCIRPGSMKRAGKGFNYDQCDPDGPKVQEYLCGDRRSTRVLGTPTTLSTNQRHQIESDTESG